MRSFILALAGMGACLFLVVAAFPAHAQTMGEYGMQMKSGSSGNWKGAGSGIDSSIRRETGMSAADSHGHGKTRTVVIPNNSSSQSDAADNSADSSDDPSTHDWERVR